MTLPTLLIRALTEHEVRTVLWVCALAIAAVTALTALMPIAEQVLKLLEAWTFNATDPLAGVR